MAYTIIGLGNPGGEYERTRHNAGRMVADFIAKKHGFGDFKKDSASDALVAKGEIAGKQAKIVEPETYMNKSGSSAAKHVKTPKDVERLVVIYDDMDLPLGSMRLSFDRSSGGHKGLESVIRSLRTKAFLRVRVGVSPTTPGGKLRKPAGEEKVIGFIVGKFKEDELAAVKKVAKRAAEAVESWIEHGKERAMTEFN